MRNRSVIFGYLLSIVLSVAQEDAAAGEVKNSVSANKVSYSDIDRLIINKNETYKASEMQTKASESRQGNYGRSFMPEFSLVAGQEKHKSANTEYEPKNYWKAEANLNIYRAGRDFLESRMRNQQLEIHKINQKATLQSEIKEAKFSYLKIIATNKIMADTLIMISKTDSHLKSAKRRVSAGLSTEADSIQFEILKTNLERKVKKLTLEKDLALNNLSVSLGLNDHENLEVDQEFPQISANLLGELNQGKQSDLKQIKGQLQLDELKESQTSRWWLPKVDLYANVGIPSLSSNSVVATNQEQEWTTGLKVSFDFGKSLEEYSETQARKFEIEATKNKLAHKEREVKALYHEYVHDLKILKELIDSSDSDIKLAEKLLRITEGEYARGVKNGPDLLESLQKLYEVKELQTENLLKYFSTEAELQNLLEGYCN